MSSHPLSLAFCVRKCAHSCKIEKRAFSFHHCLHLRSFLCFQLFSLWLLFQKRARRLRAAIHPIITGCQVPEIPLINFTAAQNGAACTQIVYSARHPWLALETVSMACYKATAQGITSAFVFFFYCWRRKFSKLSYRRAVESGCLVTSALLSSHP